jgi:hypothetical protein
MITNVTKVSSVFSHTRLHNTCLSFFTMPCRLLITQASSNGTSHMTSHMACLTSAKRRFFSTSPVQTIISMTTALTPPSALPPRPRWETDQSAVTPVTSLGPPRPLMSLTSVLTLRLTVGFPTGAGFPMGAGFSPTPSMTSWRNKKKVHVHVNRALDCVLWGGYLCVS